MIARATAPSFAVPVMAGPAPAGNAPALRISPERLRCLMLWLTGASSAIVFIEPSPYEVVSFLTLAIFTIGGLTLSPGLMPFGMLLVLINIGYSISGWTVLDEEGVITWLLTSWYLALTALFFATILGANTEARLRALTRGCVIGGVIAALAAIIGYFRIFPSLNELLLLYDRARGTFKDPNVLGAYLVFPALLALQPVISGSFRKAAKGAMLLGLLAPAILLSFSRAAWGQVVYAALVMLALTFVTTRSPSHRLRIVLLSVTGVVVMAGFIAALLSIDIVADLFKQRASFEQSYDLGAQGRFARYTLGAILALDMPFGIGPLQFHKYFPEDPHNSYLNAFMAGGWLSGACYPTLVALTLAFGFRSVFVRTPWQPTTIVVFSGYFGVATESFIIDSDHWRHAFMLMGLMWGLIAATRRHAARAGRG
ncbi:MAG: hypothetical protein QOF91_3766 [Alphaproteobacteria bacterium]|nr:hypothetical protein [Alphaproteobacteria bacterium]